MKRLITSILVSIFLIGIAGAHGKWKKHPSVPAPVVCEASGKVEKGFIPPPIEVINQLKSAKEKRCEIIVTYSAFPDSVKSAFEYAVSIWEYLIDSEVPINITARWRVMDNTTLASCGPSAYYQNLEDMYYSDRFYPVAIAEKLADEELNGNNSPDMTATFNKTIEWYFGTDGNCPSTKYDFVSTALHEITHGLGFTGFFYVNNSSGGYSEPPAIFDQYVANGAKHNLTDVQHFENPSNNMYKALTSNALYFRSPATLFDGNGIAPRLYAPSTWSDGSSVYHLNDATYSAGSENSLMTHAAGKGEAVHDPGPITMGIMADLGWKALKIKHDELKDLETVVEPVFVEASITSDYNLDSSSLYVHYSDVSFNSSDSVLLIPGEKETIFRAELPVNITQGVIDYYISATDEKQRTFSAPAGAPEDSYKLRIGPDNISPEIVHQPKEYILSKSPVLEITAFIDDNIGIDTAWVEYSYNEQEILKKGMMHDLASVYTCPVNLVPWQLKDGDSISYRIVAKDISTNANLSVLPADRNFSVEVEETFDPVFKYSNTFNEGINDFIGGDFEIITETGFIDGALHSPHPYASPEENDMFFNFATLLKYPIVLLEDGQMNYDEIVLVEPGESGTIYGDDEFWDYVIVEGSKDYGDTWLPLINGYDSRAATTWNVEYKNGLNEGNNSETLGKKEMYIRRNIDLLENGNFLPGDTIFIRFRLFSDPYAHGWGWVIDNLRIQAIVSAEGLQVFSPGDFRVYPNPFNDKFTFEYNSSRQIETINLEIYDSFGRQVYFSPVKQIFQGFKTEINFENYNPGLYFIRGTSGSQVIFSRKLIKK